MSQPIIAIAGSQTAPAGKVHMLPVKISHSGTFPHNKGHWNPTPNENGSHTSYFRGRKVTGHAAAIPATYVGVVVENVKTAADPSAVEEGFVDDMQPPEEKMEVKARFDEVVVWAQETAPVTATDPYARAIGEWLETADKIHSF
ncbi:hypothetical protein BROUX41_002656 [Berkeleyomyces rouxiae]|uniref:uncharacterized protein n=1 Tax=Berkeleyomyces rouxiae TaxID=2035830 RepID=UPI003B7C11B1